MSMASSKVSCSPFSSNLSWIFLSLVPRMSCLISRSSDSIWSLKPGFHMIATIATIAAQRSQRSLRSLRAYGNIHSAIFAIVATLNRNDRRDRNFSISAIVVLRSLRSLRCDRCDHMETRLESAFRSLIKATSRNNDGFVNLLFQLL